MCALVDGDVACHAANHAPPIRGFQGGPYPISTQTLGISFSLKMAMDIRQFQLTAAADIVLPVPSFSFILFSSSQDSSGRFSKSFGLGSYLQLTAAMPTTNGESVPQRDVNSGPAITAVTSILLAIAIILVALRCYVRVLMTKNFGWDDGVMVFTLVSILLL